MRIVRIRLECSEPTISIRFTDLTHLYQAGSSLLVDFRFGSRAGMLEGTKLKKHSTSHELRTVEIQVVSLGC